VNVAHVYEKAYADDVYSVCTLAKGDKVTVLKWEGDFIYCDYVCNGNNPGTGYMQRKDLVLPQ